LIGSKLEILIFCGYNNNMRKIFLLLLLIACLPVFGDDVRKVRIFVPSVAGTGRSGDNAFFHDYLSSEVISQSYPQARSQRASDYILKGSIVPLTDGVELSSGSASPVPRRPNPPLESASGSREYFSWEINDNIFFYDTSGEDNYDPYAVSANRPEYVLILELINNVTGNLHEKQQLIYSAVDASVGDKLSITVYNMLIGISNRSK